MLNGSGRLLRLLFVVGHMGPWIDETAIAVRRMKMRGRTEIGRKVGMACRRRANAKIV